MALIWSTAAAALALTAHWWLARRNGAEWSGAWLLTSYISGTALASWRFGSLAAGLLIPAMASTTLIIASGGHVEHIEDNQWKAATEPLRAARKRRQRWLLVRWLCLVLLCSSVAVAVGLLGG